LNWLDYLSLLVYQKRPIAEQPKLWPTLWLKEAITETIAAIVVKVMQL
jgi:hypothetical protein